MRSQIARETGECSPNARVAMRPANMWGFYYYKKERINNTVNHKADEHFCPNKGE